MKINDLSYNATGARYGYNGTHEQDKELNADGNYLDFGNFGYDTRVAMRRNQEPLSAKYPHLSGYAVFGDNPITFNDPSGYELFTSQEAWEFKNEGYNNSLGENHPFYTQDIGKGRLQIRVGEFDRSKFNDKQLEIIDKESTIINDKDWEVNVDMIDNTLEEFTYYKYQRKVTLDELDGEAVNNVHYDKDGKYTIYEKNGRKVKKNDILISRKVGGKNTVYHSSTDLSLTTLHEDGHAYFFIVSPELSGEDNNYFTYKYDREVLRAVYQRPNNIIDMLFIFMGLKREQTFEKDIKIDNPHHKKEQKRYENEKK